MTAYRQALQPFFERAGRGAAAVGCSDTDAEIAGRGKSCTCGDDICIRQYSKMMMSHVADAPDERYNGRRAWGDIVWINGVCGHQ